MVRKRPHHMPSFKIAQYVVAIAIGLLAVFLAPKQQESLDPSRIWPLSFDLTKKAMQSAPWWQDPAFEFLPSKTTYPWIQYWATDDASSPWYHTLSKDDFRCRGTGERAPIILEENGIKSYLFDCWGINHGLPWVWLTPPDTPISQRVGQERVQPALIEILNALQEKLTRPVIITSGHRCPTHHRYITRGLGSTVDKHQIAAACDFYVQGMQMQATAVIDALKAISLAREKLMPGKSMALIEKEPFHWSNAEIELVYIPAHEGRNIDNAHAYPYFTLTVRYDYEKQESVKLTLQQTRALPLE